MAKKATKKISLRFFALLFAVLMVYAGFLLVKQQMKMQELSANAVSLQQEIRQAQDTNERLQRDIEYSASDEFVEQQAREKLGWVKENETRFIENN